MKPLVLPFRRVVSSTMLAALLGSCGGSGEEIPVAYSGKVNGYECSDYYVGLNMTASGAEPATRRGGVDCQLGPELVGKGCRFYVDGVGIQFQVVILDCPFELSDVLFRCNFSKAEIAAMNDNAFAGCCFNRNSHNAYCEALPVCFTDEESGVTCERCDNGLDEDADGFVDCDDRSCWSAAECQTSTTTTTTTSVSTTTTTTIPVYRYGCNAHFRLVDFASAGLLRWKTDYSQAWMEVAADAFDCEGVLEGATFSFTDDAVGKALSLELTRSEPIEGLVNLATCRFVATEYADGGLFAVTEVEAATTDLEPIVPPPAISVIFVECLLRDLSNEEDTLASPAPR
jgi:hypothetical protein